MGKPKTNPNKIPRTQADVDRAYQRGVLDHDVTIADLRCVLREEYDLDI